MPVYYRNFKKFLFFFDLCSVLYCSYPLRKRILPLLKRSGKCIKMYTELPLQVVFSHLRNCRLLPKELLHEGV